MFHPGSLQYYFLFLNKVLGDRKMNWLMWFDVYHESYKKKHLRDWVSWRTCDELQGCRFSCCFCLFIEALMELLYRFSINLVHSWCSQAVSDLLALPSVNLLVIQQHLVKLQSRLKAIAESKSWMLNVEYLSWKMFYFILCTRF